MEDHDQPRGGPQPPHERTWRHPAELGEWTRTRDAIAATPPPLSRRLTAVIAATSLVVSAAIAVIAIPRSSRDDVSDAPDAVSVPVRAVATSVAARSVAGAATVDVVPVGDYLVAVLGQVDGAQQDDGAVLVAPDGTTAEAAWVIARDPTLGIAVLARSTADSGNDGSRDESDVLGASASELAAVPGPDTLPTGSRVVLVAADGDTTEATVGVASDVRPGLYPLVVSSAPRGACLVRDERGTAVGVAVHHRHSTWLVSYDKLAEIIGDGRAATN